MTPTYLSSLHAFLTLAHKSPSSSAPYDQQLYVLYKHQDVHIDCLRADQNFVKDSNFFVPDSNFFSWSLIVFCCKEMISSKFNTSSVVHGFSLMAFIALLISLIVHLLVIFSRYWLASWHKSFDWLTFSVLIPRVVVSFITAMSSRF